MNDINAFRENRRNFMRLFNVDLRIIKSFTTRVTGFKVSAVSRDLLEVINIMIKNTVRWGH